MMAQVTISDHTKALASLAAQLKSVADSQFDATYDAI